MLKIGVMVDQPSQARGVEAVEILGRAGTLPALDVLARWRAGMEEDTDVILSLPRLLTAPGQEGPLVAPFHPLDEAVVLWERVDAALQVLESDVVLFKTGPDFTPTTQNKDRLVAFSSHVARDGLHLVWQPRGLWSPEDLEDVSSRAPLVCASDPLSGDPLAENWVYWRVWGLGRSEIGPADLEFLMDLALDESLNGYCILATGTWKSDVRAATRLLSRRDKMLTQVP